MQKFSKRNNIIDSKLDLQSISIVLNTRIVDSYIIFFEKNNNDDFIFGSNYISSIEKIMTELGILYEISSAKYKNRSNMEKVRKKLTNIDNVNWYDAYDFIEVSLYIENYDEELLTEYNRILEEEGSLYRIVKKLVVPIIDKNQIDSIKKAGNTEFDSVNKHLANALEYLSSRKEAKYENSIKESISAVESLCSILTKINGKTATLGNMLDLLEKEGVYIHKALIEAYKKIYGYTSDEGGIRHGSGFEKDAKIEDARYMLVSCSAFINYILEKVKEKSE